MSKKTRIFTNIYNIIIMLFFYSPIALVMVYSFNDSKGFEWTGFTTNWYVELFQDELIMSSLLNTLILAAIASILSTILGTLAALGVYSLKSKKLKTTIKTVTNIPLLSPEIVTGVSLMLLFTAAKISTGWLSLIIAHISFCVPSVFLSILPKLRQINKDMYCAALDLGCNTRQAFTKVIIPEILPGILTGFLMALTYSIDDFIISYFTAGNLQTLSITIYSMTRRRISPKINALSTLMFLLVFVILLISNVYSIRKERAKEIKISQNIKNTF